MLVCKGRVVCCKEGLETDADGGLERGWKWDCYEVAKGNRSGMERKGGGEKKW